MVFPWSWAALRLISSLTAPAKPALFLQSRACWPDGARWHALLLACSLPPAICVFFREHVLMTSRRFCLPDSLGDFYRHRIGAWLAMVVLGNATFGREGRSPCPYPGHGGGALARNLPFNTQRFFFII